MTTRNSTHAGEPVKENNTASTVTSKTRLHLGGEIASSMALKCSWEIETLSLAVIRTAANVEAEGEAELATLLRTYGVRIKDLNSIIMSYASATDTVTLAEAQHVIFAGTERFPEGELG